MVCMTHRDQDQPLRTYYPTLTHPAPTSLSQHPSLTPATLNPSPCPPPWLFILPAKASSLRPLLTPATCPRCIPSLTFPHPAPPPPTACLCSSVFQPTCTDMDPSSA
eukprot:357362-Chlamydomonas_euryale.AAC.3